MVVVSLSLCFYFLFAPGAFAAAEVKAPSEGEIITDSNLTLEEATAGKKIPEIILKSLEIVDVEYYSFDGKVHRGQIVIHKELKKEVTEIFRDIKASGFPVEKAVPVSIYKWSDDESMRANNTSGFNYRSVKGSMKLSAHALGRAIDINPMQNPQIKKGKSLPEGGYYDPSKPGTISRISPVYSAFIKRGWKWGGAWRSSRDYQHFEKLK